MYQLFGLDPAKYSTPYLYYFEVASIAIAAVILIELTFKKTVPSRQKSAFLYLFIVTAFGSFFDLASTYALVFIDILPVWFNNLILVFYFLAFHGMGTCYLYYIILSTKAGEQKVSNVEKMLIIIPYAIDAVFCVLSPWIGFMGKVDRVTRTYQTGFLNSYAYAQSLFYLIAAIVTIMKNRKKIPTKSKLIVWFYTGVVFVCVTVQAVTSTVLIISFGAMLGVLIVAFTLENPTYFEDQILGIYNKLAFETVVEKRISDGKQFSVVGVRIDGLTDLREIVGISSLTIGLKEIANFLLSVGEKDELYSISDSQFAYILSGGDSEVEMYMKKVKHRFEAPFAVGDENVRLNVSMVKFSFPRDVKSSEAVMDLLEYSFDHVVDMGKETVLVANAGLLEERKRDGQVLQAIRTALAENRFMVYYQPIFSVEADGFKSAEALLRLYDEELGFIPPDEFIPLAEKNGLITRLGEYVFRETCRFIAENRIWKKGIEYIDINLSPIQCMQADLSEKFISIMDEYRLEYCRISLEVTETGGLMSARTFRENMTALISKGVRFSLDDYGTGYSNLSTVVNYPFSIVKLDHSMLWSAMKNEKAMIVLRQTIRMMKQLSLELIAEGVETDEQAQLLAYYGCDFFQGFFYAKPMPGEAFIKLLEDGNKKIPNVFI